MTLQHWPTLTPFKTVSLTMSHSTSTPRCTFSTLIQINNVFNQLMTFSYTSVVPAYYVLMLVAADGTKSFEQRQRLDKVRKRDERVMQSAELSHVSIGTNISEFNTSQIVVIKHQECRITLQHWPTLIPFKTVSLTMSCSTSTPR